MPIEFACVHCGKMLRVPDGSSGQQARCPACSQVSTVPAAASAPPTPAAPPVARMESQYPVAPPPASETNPYSAPSAFSIDTSGGAARLQLRHTKIPIGDTLARSWSIFRDNFGQCLLVGLLLLALYFGLTLVMYMGYIVVFLLAIAAEAVLQGLGVVLAVISGLALYPAMLFVAGWVLAGVVIVHLRMCRGQPFDIGNLFEGSPYAMRLWGASLLLMLLQMVLAIAIMGIPAALQGNDAVGAAAVLLFYAVSFTVYLMFMLYAYFVVDQNRGALDSLKDSMHYMRGNKLRALLLWIIVSVCGSLVTLFTCCIGYFAVFPFFFLFWTVLYLSATGQPTVADMGTIGQGESPFAQR